ncbi:MAG: sialate O-acetylesterase [Fuerstiella sp.]|nr:sialate O-acetylesterase [Fuerstiella sp.]MCP4859265.1 sialate O-acetylesterase [Fuerstiella sp.]
MISRHSRSSVSRFALFIALLATPLTAQAELKLPAIISDHMVLQQKQANPIWGWDTPGTNVVVAFRGQVKEAKAGDDGKWTVKLDAVDASFEPASIVIEGSTRRKITDVLVGEVWMCSGQSNMGMTVAGDWKYEVESLSSNHPNLRLITVPRVGTQELQSDFKGQWEAANSNNCRAFSAVGFFYGRYLHEILDVPVGLINNAWGGSAAEAWVRRESLEKDPRFRSTMDGWKQRETQLQSDVEKEKYEAALAAWKTKAAEAKAAGKRAPRGPRSPDSTLAGNQRPGNIFAGVVHPTLGYGMKGVIWYQGESNAGRAWEYAQLFPYMIEQWRAEWGQGDFPFYWVQLADFQAEVDQPGESSWAELRESQSKTMSLPNTGEAVIIDLGEANDIHPKNKYDVAARLVRWALAKDYGIENIEPQSPTYQDIRIVDNKAILTFDHIAGGLRTVDVNDVRGFAICGEDRQWVWASAKITGTDSIEVWSDDVTAPVAVRYAWATNPVCNVHSRIGLPLTPFRTDNFPMTTKPADAK